MSGLANRPARNPSPGVAMTPGASKTFDEHGNEVATPWLPRKRSTTISRDMSAGCFVFEDGGKVWVGATAQAIAARHHDLTGHTTWCICNMTIRYGGPPALAGES